MCKEAKTNNRTTQAAPKTACEAMARKKAMRIDFCAR
jgi:hypothetical protein